jgi:acetyl-CoA acetyltransferase
MEPSADIERVAVIRGVGMSRTGRRLHADPLQLTGEAALAAIGDAGLDPAQIDGVATYPGAMGSTPGMSGAGVFEVAGLLGLDLRWFTGGSEVPGQLGSVVNAVLAVAGGLCRHVLCFRTVYESTAQEQAGSRASTLTGPGSSRPMRADGIREWTLPFGALHTSFGGLETRRYFHETGGGREQLGQIAVTARRNAAGNEAALYREPLSLEDYLSSRMISEPLCLYDCDVPIDGSIAFVVSRRSESVGRSGIVGIEAIGSAAGMQAAADMLWSRTTLAPGDVGVAELYDGFSILAVQWLEALGLCPRGQGAAFIEGGHNIALDGPVPLSTGGGQLSAGRMHGYGHLYEACLQLRGHGGDRQVRPLPEVAAVSNGAGGFTGCLLLSAL